MSDPVIARRRAKIAAALCCFASLMLQCALASAQSGDPQKSAQDRPAAPIASFTSRSQLVLVPVIVTDHRGGHVTGLKKENFSLLDNGVERGIALFDETVAGSERIVAPKTNQQVYSNNLGAASAKRLVILALDTINTSFTDQVRARKQILKFLTQSVDPDALIAVVVLTPRGVKVVHDFTTDTSILIAAVSEFTGKTAFAEGTSAAAADAAAVQSEVEQLGLLSDNTNQAAIAGQRQLAIRWTYDALTQIALAYSGVPGRKSLIWVTGGFPFSLADNNNQVSGLALRGNVSDTLWAYEQMWQALTQSNFAVYPVDARGFVNTAVIPAGTGAKATGGKPALPDMTVVQPGAHDASLETFRDFAEMTGGKAFFNTNDLSKSFRDASNDSSTYYLLGFYLGKEAQPGWHDLKVKVYRSHVQVRARSGYLVETRVGHKNRPDDVRNAVLSPFDSTALPLEVRWTAQTPIPVGAKAVASFELMLKPAALSLDETENNHMKFDVIAIARQSDGTIAGTVQRAFEAHIKGADVARFQKAGMVYDGKFDLPAGNYLVRFVVQDRLTGRVGSVSAPLTIR